MASASRKAGLKGPDWKCHLLLPDKMPFRPPFLCLHSVAWPLARFLHLIDDSPLVSGKVGISASLEGRRGSQNGV